MLSTRFRRAFAVAVVAVLLAAVAVAVIGQNSGSAPEVAEASLTATPSTTTPSTTSPTTPRTPVATTLAGQTQEATVTLTKVGPLQYFGFRLSCTDGSTDGFNLKGGGSRIVSFTAVQQQVSCTIAEEAVPGWTTTIDVTGAVRWQQDVGGGPPSVEFSFGPGDSVGVTFTNRAGYLSQPPTGTPPDLNED